MSDLSELFELAASFLNQIFGNLSSEQLLYLYARFKQVNEGPCNIPKPGFLDFKGKPKWQAWKDLGNMTKEQAQQEYVDAITAIDPEWQSKVDPSNTKSGGGGIGGVSVSTLSRPDDDVIIDSEKTAFDWCKECNVKRMAKVLPRKHINSTDEEGMTLLHWASDRGHAPVVEYLLQQGAEVNVQDADGQTPLHFASSCDHTAVVEILLKNKANTSITDSDGLTAENVAASKDIVKLLNPS